MRVNNLSQNKITAMQRPKNALQNSNCISNIAFKGSLTGNRGFIHNTLIKPLLAGIAIMYVSAARIVNNSEVPKEIITHVAAIQKSLGSNGESLIIKIKNPNPFLARKHTTVIVQNPKNNVTLGEIKKAFKLEDGELRKHNFFEFSDICSTFHPDNNLDNASVWNRLTIPLD